MANITDTTLFIGLLNIAADNISDSMDDIIEQKEAELLPKWFGYALYKDITAVSPSTAAAVLVNGEEYTDSNGDLQYLTGLKDFLQYFMYFYIVRDEQSINSEIGERESISENAQKVDVTDKLNQNYNKGVQPINEMLDYINDNLTDYPHAILSSHLGTLNRFGI